ncbi:hypothetical protein AM1_5008 [Acaryochloris marina MBIC11017]|uniref:Uncharacterized protein n=1 Tax=Acaryochloris marina (strain MBIC 11017) TaxID=329726 RepID=B0C5W5_ACAM1|nr:hypothetical protein AM1_5008 [Acaryochloris marina MBIC11017]
MSDAIAPTIPAQLQKKTPAQNRGLITRKKKLRTISDRLPPIKN